jgi:hypothetical protein
MVRGSLLSLKLLNLTGLVRGNDTLGVSSSNPSERKTLFVKVKVDLASTSSALS